ncbi:NAD(P)-dependent oxidoreductase [Pseudoalteromonas luteoviolacea]|nr:NAD(P)-dependent oxidoreductase [Pseudoalteromonas luteoviolacea]
MNVLILGCGEVGQACAQRLLMDHSVEKLTLHCKSMQRRTALTKELGQEDGVDIIHFDIFCNEGFDRLSALIEALKPDYIIDCLPIGNILVPIFKNTSLEQASEMMFAYFNCLKAAFEHGVKRIQKVSSGGAGGLGVSCPYRHGLSTISGGDLLLWKIYFNGALHQLLINLHESAHASVGLTIPRALIGYEATDEAHIIGCGDSTVYTRTELELCAHPSQFGFITKEDVARSTLNSLFSTCFEQDCITQMCRAGINQSSHSAQLLESLTQDMALHEQSAGISVISLGSLGNQVTKDMIELLLAIEWQRGQYDQSIDPRSFISSRGYFSQNVLNHFEFSCGAVDGDRQIDHSLCNLNHWHALALRHTSNSELTTKHIGRYLAAIYQHKGIEKK